MTESAVALLRAVVRIRRIPLLRVVNPAHPGNSILFGCLGIVGEDEDALGVPEAAAKLGMPREALQRVLDGNAPVTPDLARRLEAAGWSTAEFWLSRQASYDAAQARRRRRAAAT